MTNKTSKLSDTEYDVLWLRGFGDAIRSESSAADNLPGRKSVVADVKAALRAAEAGAPVAPVVDTAKEQSAYKSGYAKGLLVRECLADGLLPGIALTPNAGGSDFTRQTMTTGLGGATSTDSGWIPGAPDPGDLGEMMGMVDTGAELLGRFS